MELFGGRIAVTVAELTSGEGGECVMTYSNYLNLTSRRSVLTVLRPGKGLDHPALVAYDSLPERFKTKFTAKYGDPSKMINNENEVLVLDETARDYYSAYRLSDGSALKDAKVEEYTLNASVLTRLIEACNTQMAMRHLCGNGTPVRWAGILAESERLRNEYCHTLPRNEARLREKMRQFKSDGYGCLVSGKLSNVNAVKIGEAEGRQIIALKRSRVPVYTTAQIFEAYNRIAAAKGWKPLKSMSALTQFLSRPEVEARWKDAELGDKAAKMIYSRQHATLLPTVRDALWYGDGTKLNLYYKTFRDGKYVPATLQAYEVIDAASEVLLGYNISTTENFESMHEAVRDALEFAGHKPVELVYDNQGGTKRADAREWLSKAAELSRPTAPHNAPSKTIESIFGRFQSQVLHKYWYFTGGNVTDKSDRSKPNLDFLEANVDKLPTYQELMDLYPRLRDEWNRMEHPKHAGKSRMEVYLQSVNPRSVALTDAIRRDLFWVTTPKPSTFTNYGITITVAGVRHQYEVLREDGMPDLEWRSRNTGRQFYVQYDPRDMSEVRLLMKDPNYGFQFVTLAKTYIEIHRALQDQTEEERRFIRREQEEVKEDRVRRYLENKALEMEHGVAPEQNGLASPGLKGISQKEFERLADKARRIPRAPEPSEIYPSTTGQAGKALSNMTYDELAAIDRI